MLCTLLLLLGTKTGTVRIHLVDARNKPIANHELWLTETNSTKSVRPFGVQWVIPSDGYKGKTDSQGNAAIKGVPLRKPMMVVTRFGPRFDPFVRKQNPSFGDSTMDVMKFEGAVYANRTARVVLAQDREITGTVVDAAGKPLQGVEVSLSDTGFGHMGGYPGTTLDVQKSDANGNYRFTRLPNCSFLLGADAPEGYAVESALGKGPMELIAIVGHQWTSQGVSLDRATTVCNFRISRTAKLTVVFKGTAAELKGWTGWMGSRKESTSYGGQDLDYDAKSSTMTRVVMPGEIIITLSKNYRNTVVTAAKVTLIAGEERTIELNMADILRRKKR